MIQIAEIQTTENTAFICLTIFFWSCVILCWFGALKGGDLPSGQIKKAENRTARGGRWLAAGALGVLVAARFKMAEFGSGLDPSWQFVLEHATRNRWIYGVDLNFTYGPLGPFSVADINCGLGGLNQERIAFSVWAATFLAYSWGLWAARVNRVTAILTWLWLLLVPAMVIPYVNLAWAAWHLSRERSPDSRHFFWSVVSASLALALYAAVKFTYFVVGAGVLVACVPWHRWRSLRPLHFMPAGIAVSGFFVAWMFAGQPLSAVPIWFYFSLIISGAYVEGMQVMVVSETVIWISAVIFLLSVAWLCARGAWELWRFRSEASPGGTLMMLGLLAIVWKHGLVRADEGHLALFLWTAPLIAQLVATLPAKVRFPKWWERSAPPLAGALSVTALMIMGAFRSPEPILTNSLDLPKLKKLCGERPVDVFNYEQSVVFSNQLNYRPRPVFQSYQAYHPSLTNRNAEWWQTQGKSNLLLARVETIDGRLSTSEDAACWPLWLGQLRPVGAEKNFILLEPIDGSKPEWHQVGVADFRLGDEIAVPETRDGELLRFRLEVGRSAWGKVVSQSFQPEALSIIVKLDEGMTKRWRLIPELARMGLVLNPLIENGVEWIAWYANDQALGKVPKAISVVPENGRFAEWLPEIKCVWEVTEEVSISPEHQTSARLITRELQCDKGQLLMGTIAPQLVADVVRFDAFREMQIEFSGRPAFRIDAPSVIGLKSRPGGGVFEGLFAAPEPGPKNKDPGDGVTFELVAARHDGEEMSLLSRHLKPTVLESDRGWQSFSVTVPGGFPWILIRARNGENDRQDRLVIGSLGWKASEPRETGAEGAGSN